MQNPQEIQIDNSARGQANLRCGTAVVEFALVLPLLFLIVFGGIQACNAIFSKQFITEVSYQGAMSASKSNADKDAVIAEMQQLMVAHGLATGTCQIVGINGTDYDLLTSGQDFKVVVTAPPSANQSGPSIATYTTLQAESIGRKQ